MQEQGNKFDIVKRARSFTHAGRGVYLFLKATHNAWIHCILFLGAVILGFVLEIGRIDWMFLFLAAGVVLTAEALNTSIEIDMDLTSPEYHPFARDTKDVAAGAVLIASIAALIIGLFIFVPPLIELYS